MNYCPDCGNQFQMVEEYGQLYCYNCKKYAVQIMGETEGPEIRSEGEIGSATTSQGSEVEPALAQKIPVDPNEVPIDHEPSEEEFSQLVDDALQNVQSLATSDPQGGRGRLIDMLSDGHDHERMAVLIWLREDVEDNGPDPEFVPAVRGAYNSALNLDVRREAVLSIGELRDREMLPELKQRYPDEPGPVRSGTLFTLSELGDPDLIPMVENELQNSEDDEVLEACIRVLQDIEGQASFRTLFKSLNHTNATVRKGAVGALARRGDPRIRPSMDGLLKDPDPEVRTAAENAVKALTLAAVSASQGLGSGGPSLMDAAVDERKKQKLHAENTLSTLELRGGTYYLPKEYNGDFVMRNKSLDNGIRTGQDGTSITGKFEIGKSLQHSIDLTGLNTGEKITLWKLDISHGVKLDNIETEAEIYLSDLKIRRELALNGVKCEGITVYTSKIKGNVSIEGANPEFNIKLGNHIGGDLSLRGTKANRVILSDTVIKGNAYFDDLTLHLDLDLDDTKIKGEAHFSSKLKGKVSLDGFKCKKVFLDGRPMKLDQLRKTLRG